jgi:thioredoxin 1
MRWGATFRLAATLLAAFPSQAALAAAPAEFSETAFATAQAQGRTIVVETYAPWCLPCRIQSPILDSLRSRDPFKQVLVLRIGERTPSPIWKRLRLNGFGTLVIYKGGREMARGNPTNETAVADLLRRAL